MMYRPRGAAVAVVGPARLKEGDSVTLRCTSQSHPPATKYRWFQGPRRALLRGLGRGPEVTVPAVGRHSGPYRCAAENEIGLGDDSARHAPRRECEGAAGRGVLSPLGAQDPIRAQGGGRLSGGVLAPIRPLGGALADSGAAGGSGLGIPHVPCPVADPPELLPWGNCTVRGSGPGEEATCHCAAEGNPPPRLEWRLPNRTLPGDFEGPELRATSWVRGPVVSGELRGPAGALANVSCAVTNAHGQSQAALPAVPAGDDNLLLMISSGVIGGVLLLSVLAIMVYKVARARKDEEEGPSIYDNEGNGEQRQSLKGGKPSKAKKEEQFNLYSKAKAGGEELGIDDYEAMERMEDYENLAAGGAGHYGNVGTWQPHLLSEQIYSNV
ncbi:sialic acid-binding Ig-like lectin 10 [Dermochelys coriacea]|uniref:sialic acid-binding Ig-like lectin 10 n=1 Tax=Dermochelys coriacea TaxID=27794 RepID=UPI001CA83450|nr:sialic acid-binding Ig-like lectin 10 [Dermochelys coriacea]